MRTVGSLKKYYINDIKMAISSITYREGDVNALISSCVLRAGGVTTAARGGVL